GRPPKSIELHLTEGTFRRDRHGGTADVVAEGEPVPFARLEGEALKWWKAYVPELTAAGIAKALDSAALTIAPQMWALYCKMSRALDRMPVTHRRFPQLLNALAIASSQYAKLTDKFGMSPLSRQRLRVSVPAPKISPVPCRDRNAERNADRARMMPPMPLEPKGKE